jgi:hypothetical protein
VAVQSSSYAIDTTIALGASQSGAVGLNGRTLKRIHFPASTEGSALTFQQATTETGTYLSTYDSEGNLIEVPITAGRVLELSPALFAGALFVKVTTTNGSGTAVVQTGADAVLQLVGVDL